MYYVSLAYSVDVGMSGFYISETWSLQMAMSTWRKEPLKSGRVYIFILSPYEYLHMSDDPVKIMHTF